MEPLGDATRRFYSVQGATPRPDPRSRSRRPYAEHGLDVPLEDVAEDAGVGMQASIVSSPPATT